MVIGMPSRGPLAPGARRIGLTRGLQGPVEVAYADRVDLAVVPFDPVDRRLVSSTAETDFAASAAAVSEAVLKAHCEAAMAFSRCVQISD